ncbi:MAG TPA: type II toxin-antitoxin system VapC family toxin [Thermomicrobiales bacterium]|nr:type II toxin-antitoxin system VapC family toxin [Thermomicrobiales bacterium]
MAYLIDTDIVLDHLAAHPEAVKLLDGLADSGLVISIITYMEAYQSVLRSPDRHEAEEQFAAFVAVVPVISFSEDVARRRAELREALRAAGKRVRSRALDLLIAATALAHGLTLVTRNTNDYDDIPGLLLYRS